MKRREVLRSLAGGCALLTAGCSAFEESRGMIDFNVENNRQERMIVRSTFIRPDEADRTDAIEYHEQFELSPNEEAFQDAVAPNQQYRIEVDVGSEDSRRSFTTYHFHYGPFGDRVDRLVQIFLNQDGVGFHP